METAEIITDQKAAIDDRLDVFDLGEADGLKKRVKLTLWALFLILNSIKV